ncbi:MAG TPA: ABC transporter permease [Candidatus Limnocylindrales bacterium]|nr:ABC transporter permease [Candidatus Limnocylindrales bacterium]
MRDIRYALRQFLNAPVFTLTVVLTLAIGIGATTAIFTLVHAVLLNSLPVAKPSELYRVGDIENCCVNGGLQGNWSLFSYDKYRTFRDNTSGFLELAAFQSGNSLIGVRRSGSPQPAQSLRSEFVSGNYFAMFGIGPYAGRVLTPQDDHKGAAPVAVMSYRAWQQKFAGDPSVVGASFAMNGQPFTVVGIAPQGFFGDRLQEPTAFWLPISAEPLIDGPGSLIDFPQQDWLDIIGRIAPDANPKQIGAQMQVELQQWLLSPVAKLQPAEREFVPKQTLRLSPGGAGVQRLRDEIQSGLRLLMGISALVLAIACANVANLLLVRATNRKLQTSIRAALGAQASRQIRQVLTESVVLAVLGGIAGIALAYGGTFLILRLAFQNTEVAIRASPSLPVLAFTFGVSLLTGILFGTVPAWVTARAAPADALRGAGRSTGRTGGWTQKSLVVAQAALSLVLLSAAGLLTQSLRNMQGQHFGFETPNRYILHIDPTMAGYKPAQIQALYRRLHDSLAAIPGVRNVSFSLYSPMEGDNWGETVFIEGQAPPSPDSDENNASWVRVSAGYFDLFGTKIIQGRSFNEQDTPTSQHVAIVNQTFAKRFFKDGNAIGKHFGNVDMRYAGQFEIVGVTEDTEYREPTRKIPPMFFLPDTQSVAYDDPRFVAFEDRNHYLNAIELKTRAILPGFEPQVRRAIADVNPDLAIIDFMPFADQVRYNFSQQATISKLTSLFGLMALILASVGLYGVTACSVERRTNEIGIRMALGAGRMNVLRLVLRGALVEMGIALAIGIPATIAAGHAMAAQLFGVKPYDPLILLVTAAVLVLAAFLAAVIPARRAATLDPARALHTE